MFPRTKSHLCPICNLRPKLFNKEGRVTKTYCNKCIAMTARKRREEHKLAGTTKLWTKCSYCKKIKPASSAHHCATCKKMFINKCYYKDLQKSRTISRIASKKDNDNLSDYYVNCLLFSDGYIAGYKHPQELILTKRLQVAFKREIRRQENAQN